MSFVPKQRDLVACDVRAKRVTSSNAAESFFMDYKVYALWSESHDKIYVGSTNNLDRRLQEHKKGQSAYTKNFGPWLFFFTENATTKEEVLKKEKYFKSGWGRKRLQKALEEWQSGRMRQS